MVKRRDVIRFLEQNGFKKVGGTKHDKYQKGNCVTSVPRHREVKDNTFKQILRETGLDQRVKRKN